MRFAPAAALAALSLAGCLEPGSLPVPGDVSVSPEAPAMSSAFGRVTEATVRGDTVTIAIDAEAVDCRRAATTWTRELRLHGEPPLPQVGAVAGVEAMDPAQNGTWGLVRTFDAMPAYAEACAHLHERDVHAVPRTETRGPDGPGVAVSIVPLAVPLGEDVPVAIALRTAEGVDATEVRIEELRLVSQHAPATIPCRLEGPSGPLRVAGTLDADVTVACAEDTVTMPTYEDCSARGSVPGPAGRPDLARDGDPDAPCETVRARDPTADLVGALVFTDELGAAHRVNTTLRQFLYLARPASLELDAPATVSSRDAFRVTARYVAANGTPITTSQVVLTLAYPGLEDRGFGMFLDEASGTWTFAWDDLHEWKPLLWREGTYALEVDALDHEGRHVPARAVATIAFE